MPNPQIYTDALKTFTDKYGLENYDYAELAEVQKKFSYIDEFIMNSPTGRGAAGLFTALAAKTMSLYFKNATELNKNGKYMTSFNLNDFLKDFDDLAQAKYESELEKGQESKRPKFAGAELKQISRAIAKDYGKTNKTLPALWFDRLKDKKMSVDELRAITASAQERILRGRYDDDKSKGQGDLINVVAAHEAMKQLRQSREGFIGFFWKLFNRELNAKEEEYMTVLDSAVNDIKRATFDVQKAREELTGKTVMGKEVKVEKKEKTVAVKTSLDKSKKTPEKIAPVSSRVEAKKQDFSHEDALAKDLYDKLPSNGLPEANVKYAIEKIIVPRMLNTAKEANESFDEKIASGKDPKKAFEVVVRSVFAESVNSSSIYVGSAMNKMDVAPIIANGIIQNFTAAAFYPNELGQLVDTYIQQNIELYNKCVESGDDFRDTVDALNSDMQNDNREKVFNDGGLFNDGYEEKNPAVWMIRKRTMRLH